MRISLALMWSGTGEMRVTVQAVLSTFSWSQVMSRENPKDPKHLYREY